MRQAPGLWLARMGFSGIESLEEQAFAEHHFVDDTLTYVFPTDADLTLVAVSMPISEFPSFKKEPLKHLLAHLYTLPLLAPGLRKAEIAADVKGAGNIPCCQRVPYGPGWALVGDSQQVFYTQIAIKKLTKRIDFSIFKK